MSQALLEAAPVSRFARRRAVTDGFLDWIERLVLLAFYSWLVVRLLTSYWANGGLASLLLLPSEGLVVFFVLIRRQPTAVSRRWGEWLLAMTASCAPLLAAAETDAGWLSPAVGATLLLMGMLVQLHAKLTLGRSFGCVPAHRGLKLSGPYRFIRHPMYAGYLIGHLGFLLLNPSLWNLGLYALSYGLQVPRLLAEERLLSRDPRYRAYQAGVRYRLIPGLF
jgi:protein-S-isoprenylcysteine O-methyltransferase Ste14